MMLHIFSGLVITKMMTNRNFTRTIFLLVLFIYLYTNARRANTHNSEGIISSLSGAVDYFRNPVTPRPQNNFDFNALPEDVQRQILMEAAHDIIIEESPVIESLKEDATKMSKSELIELVSTPKNQRKKMNEIKEVEYWMHKHNIPKSEARLIQKFVKGELNPSQQRAFMERKQQWPTIFEAEQAMKRPTPWIGVG